MRKPPDVVDEYKSEFGYFGSSLQMGVLGLRNQDQKSGTASSAVGKTTAVSQQSPQGHIKG